MKLVTPSKQYQESYNAYIEELGEQERYPFTLDLPHHDFDALLQTLSDYRLGKNLPEYSVTNSTLWLIDDDEIVGVTNLRHYLNERIKHCGGHIGLGIRPSYQGKGLGKELMRLSIETLFSMGLEQIHIHCYKSNISSAQTIKANAGVLDSEFEQDNQVIQRYLVNHR